MGKNMTPTIVGTTSSASHEPHKKTTRKGWLSLVGLVGLEPMTPTMSTWCSNQLSYNPTGHNVKIIA